MRGIIADLFAREFSRSSGVGRTLISACEKEPRRQGLTQIMIGVLTKSTRTTEIYAKKSMDRIRRSCGSICEPLGGATMATIFARFFVVATALAAATPAVAETWDCAVRPFVGRMDAKEFMTLRIKGEILDWQNDEHVSGPARRTAQFSDGSPPSPLGILENNALVVSAVSSRPPYPIPLAEPNVMVCVVLMRKADGHLRVENLVLGSGYDVEDGHCTRWEKPEAP